MECTFWALAKYNKFNNTSWRRKRCVFAPTLSVRKYWTPFWTSWLAAASSSPDPPTPQQSLTNWKPISGPNQLSITAQHYSSVVNHTEIKFKEILTILYLDEEQGFVKLNTKVDDYYAVSDEREPWLSHKSPAQLQEHLNTILVSKIQHSCLYKQITMWSD